MVTENKALNKNTAKPNKRQGAVLRNCGQRRGCIFSQAAREMLQKTAILM